jgi:hypothetical protein
MGLILSFCHSHAHTHSLTHSLSPSLSCHLSIDQTVRQQGPFQRVSGAPPISRCPRPFIPLQYAVSHKHRDTTWVTRRPSRVTYLSQRRLAHVMDLVVLGLWFGGRQPTARNLSRIANVCSRDTGTVQCGREETGRDSDDSLFMT